MIFFRYYYDQHLYHLDPSKCNEPPCQIILPKLTKWSDYIGMEIVLNTYLLIITKFYQLLINLEDMNIILQFKYEIMNYLLLEGEERILVLNENASCFTRFHIEKE
jgi:hypothetical protein